jgi:plastocyanin/uncharacterized membrane protein
MNNKRQQARLTGETASPAPHAFLNFWTHVAALIVLGISAMAHNSQHTVTIRQMHFDPSQIRAEAGDVIEWKNEDIFSHSVTANNGSFDSGLIPPGSSWQTTIGKPATIAYHCRPHPNMKAEVIVQVPGEHGHHTHADAQGEKESLRWSPPNSPDELHPILVNFTAALLPLALLSDIFGRILRRQALHSAALCMVTYEAIITPLTAAAGWWWKIREGQQLHGELITVHQWLGTVAAVLFIVLALWRWQLHRCAASPSWAYFAFAFISLIALIYQGSLGGAMVFGH